MKKIIIAFAALAAAFSLASCSREQIETPSADLKLNVNVAGLDGSADTRAVKTAWAEGDRIDLWYQGNKQLDPDLVIRFDGTKWTRDASAKVSGNEPAASGNILYLYEAGNDLSKYSVISSMYYGGTMNLLYGCDFWEPATYTYENNTLSFDIKRWSPVTEFQVVVTGIDPSKYQLKCSNLLRFLFYYMSDKSVSTGNGAFGDYVSGVAHEDGAAFYFKSARDCSASAEYVFTLKNIETKEEKTYTVSGKTHEEYALTAVKLAADKFE